ncbi:type II secretion system protein GspM [Neorhizobium sp. BETTINA12A]|uniref:type II secretion system protein GspM n=1 Tax=Neorhizobium sp. BETTINA12A TaxID=2908924 RepID=UPI001FF4BBF4|nr:type II secretion system protein GspM [Neorhizobium sp. BETTINA12A]MCJ9753648.1 type II secretion system protein GspM [Neorhizobium sp. BETTINA12A]
MTELLITLMNAPRYVQRSVALGMLGLATTIVVITVVYLGSFLSSKANDIADMRVELFRLNEIITRRPLADASTSSLGPAAGTLFIEGESLPAIQAKLQERVNAIARSSGATIASISGTSQTEFNGAAYVGVRADMAGSLKAFHEVVRQLETSEPPLIIRQASIRGTNRVSQGVLSGPLELAGQVTVYGAVNPAAVLPEKGKP